MRLISNILSIAALAVVLCGCGEKRAAERTGVYVKKGSSSDLCELRSDGSFLLSERGVALYGNYKVDGARLSLTSHEGEASARFRGNHITDNEKNTWLKTEAGTLNPAVYYVAGGSLYRLVPDCKVAAVVYTGLPKTVNLVWDAADRKLLLAAWDSGAPILAFDTHKGGDAWVQFDGPGFGGQGFAYDETTSNLFLGLYYGGVYAKGVDGAQGWRQLVAAAALSPMIGQRGQLVLDPDRQHVYFRSAFNGDCDQCRYVWRVNYDGSGLTKIIRANGGDALAIDPSTGQLYFSDEPGDGTIKRANLDGSGVHTVMTLPVQYANCLRIVLDEPADKMYLYLARDSKCLSRAVARASLTGANLEILTELHNAGEGQGFALVTLDPQRYLPDKPKAELDTVGPP